MLKIEDAVSETLLITLYMRHLASNRPDPIIRDESASRLVAEIDYDFSKFDHAERSIIGTAIRAPKTPNSVLAQAYFLTRYLVVCMGNPV